MKIDFEKEPFVSLRPELRSWFQQLIDEADLSPTSSFWYSPLPEGSSMGDAMTVSICKIKLYPKEVKSVHRRFTPVEAEFVL